MSVNKDEVVVYWKKGGKDTYFVTHWEMDNKSLPDFLILIDIEPGQEVGTKRYINKKETLIIQVPAIFTTSQDPDTV